MSDQDTKPNSEQTDSTATNTEDKSTKTFTQEDVDKAISERLKREREKAEKTIAEKVAEAAAEAERKAKLSAEEKEAEDRKKREAETAEREREITLRENRAEARELLQERNISADLVNFVVDVDADTTRENIDNLEKAFLKAVEEGVEAKLKGKTPKDKSTSTPEPAHSGTVVL